MKTWYSIKAQGQNEAVIDIFDIIGYWGISARDFIDDLKRLGDSIQNIRVRINSDGGEVFDGIAIYNALKRHPANVTVEVYGIAASIASIIAMAGDKIVMPANTFMFIHDPLAIVIGDSEDMKSMADTLDKIASALQSTYMVKSGKSEKEVKKWMNEDTWFSAEEALAAGLADEVTDAVKMAANANLGKFKNLPEGLKPFASEDVIVPDNRDPSTSSGRTATNPNTNTDTNTSSDTSTVPAPTPEELTAAAEKCARDILAECTRAGVPEAATSFLDRGLSADEVKAKLADADKVRARCLAAKLPDRANNYIKAGMTAKEVADDLFDVLIARQGPEIDGKFGPESPTMKSTQPHVIDIRAINKRYQDKEKNFGRKS